MSFPLDKSPIRARGGKGLLFLPPWPTGIIAGFRIGNPPAGARPPNRSTRSDPAPGSCLHPDGVSLAPKYSGSTANPHGIMLSEVNVMDIKKIKEVAVPILRQYGVEKAAVFGSYARGDQNQDSDIDILIEYAPNARKTLLVRARIINELKNALQRDVDVITEKSLSRHFRDEVLREKKVIM